MDCREEEILVDLKEGGWISRETWNRLTIDSTDEEVGVNV